MANFEKSMISVFLVVLSLSSVAFSKNVIWPDWGPIQGFYVVQQWLGSRCNEEDITCCYPTPKPKPSFTLYGLWPFDNKHRFPSDCGGRPSDINLIKPLEGELQVAWPTILCDESGLDFWFGQWTIRGSCCKSLFNETVYFQNAINLKHKLDIFQALSKAGITPDNQFYPIAAIKKAITSSFGGRPFLTCTDSKQGNNQIWRVIVCVDKTATNVIKCPNKSPDYDCTSDNVFFPSYYPN